MEIIKKTHKGVYGIALQDGQILMIKKARGPYTGMFDLPGGGIEPDETTEEGLHREFMEEVECTLKDVLFLGEVEDRFDFVNIKNENIDFHHIGKYYEVSLSDKSKNQQPTGQAVHSLRSSGYTSRTWSYSNREICGFSIVFPWFAT